MSNEMSPEHRDVDLVQLSDAYVDFMTNAAENREFIELATDLARKSTNVLPVSVAGVFLAGPGKGLSLVGTSSEVASLVDLLCVLEHEGPCNAAFSTGVPVRHVVDGSIPSWATYESMATKLGVGFACAYPLRAHRKVVGSMGFLGPRPLSVHGLQIAETFANSMTVALLRAEPDESAQSLARQLHVAIDTRAAIDQAKGILVARFGCDEEFALGQLNAVARILRTTLGEVARDVATRDESSRVGKMLVSPLFSPS